MGINIVIGPDRFIADVFFADSGSHFRNNDDRGSGGVTGWMSLKRLTNRGFVRGVLLGCAACDYDQHPNSRAFG